MSDPIDTFRAEAAEHLTVLEGALLEVEQQPDNPDLVALAFRAMHTVKGAGGMFGFNDLSDFTHHLETVLDRVRKGEFAIDADLISVLLDAKDHIEGRLRDPMPTAQQLADCDALLARLRAFIMIVARGGCASSFVPGRTDQHRGDPTDPCDTHH
jgi:two-component system, chemotaxis family, sensor kinase CheA